MNLFDLMAKITLDTSDYEKGLSESEEQAQSFGQRLKTGLKTAGKVGAAAVGAVTVGAVAFGTVLVKNTNQLAAYGDHIDKASQKMGISAQAYQEWDAILQHSGTSIDGMQRGMITLSKAAVDGSDAFERLGLSQQEVASMSQEDLFAATIKGLQGMEAGSERTALAQKLLGGAAKELGPLLNTSAEETEAMRQRVHELGGVMSDEAVKAAAAYQDSMQDMSTAMSGMRNSIVGKFLPGITTVMDGLTMVFSGDSGSGIGKINEGISSVVTTITNGLPAFLSVGSQIVVGLASAIVSNLPQVAAAAIQIIPQIVMSISSMLPQLITSGTQVILELMSGLVSAIPVLVAQAPTIITNLVDAIISAVPMLITGGAEMMIGLIDGLVAALPDLIAMAPDIIMALVDAFITNAPKLLSAGMELLNHVVTGLVSLGPTLWDAGKRLVMGLLDRLSNITASFGAIGKNIINSIKNAISSAFGSLSGVVSAKFNSIKETISSAFSSAFSTVKGIVDKLKTIFNFSWSLPKIKLPHFSIGKGQTVLGVELPKISVSWYKKAYEEPYMFNRPTVVGGLGFGDGIGSEMVYGKDALMRDIREAVASEMPKVIKLYLDGDKLVGGTSERMDGSLGQMQEYQLRWEGA